MIQVTRSIDADGYTVIRVDSADGSYELHVGNAVTEATALAELDREIAYRQRRADETAKNLAMILELAPLVRAELAKN